MKTIYLVLNFPYLVWHKIKLFLVKILQEATISHAKLNKKNNYISCEVKKGKSINSFSTHFKVATKHKKIR